ncbi:MAG: hypothetical protein K0R40_4263 [Burkholderiales bacterium]|nr:hypothetical protein [Burkholderiales bacterium]
MDIGLKGRTVLITGASRNLGSAAALAFAGEGANLAICTSAKMKELNQVADDARKLGVKVVAEKCDVTDGAAVAAFVKKTRDQLGGVDVAVNIAGFRAESPFLEATWEEWAHAIDVNLSGPFPSSASPAASRANSRRTTSPPTASGRAPSAAGRRTSANPRSR